MDAFRGRILDQRIQTFHCQSPHPLLLDPHGGQGRVEHLADGGVVKTNDGDVVRDAVAVFQQRRAAPGGNAVVVRKKAVGSS